MSLIFFIIFRPSNSSGFAGKDTTKDTSLGFILRLGYFFFLFFFCYRFLYSISFLTNTALFNSFIYGGRHLHLILPFYFFKLYGFVIDLYDLHSRSSFTFVHHFPILFPFFLHFSFIHFLDRFIHSLPIPSSFLYCFIFLFYPLYLFFYSRTLLFFSFLCFLYFTLFSLFIGFIIK